MRSFDTSGNYGNWTSLIASQSTLIDSAEILEITANLITSGTITGTKAIVLDGVNTVIKSNSYVAGSAGWIIRGNGTAEFANTSIRGTITANAVTTTGLTIYSNGAVTTTSGKFGVTAGGVLSATEVNISGAITATSGTFTGTVNAAGGTMTGYLRAGDVYIGKNVYDASEHNGIGIDGSWNNAWVRRDTNDTTYFRVGSSSTYIQMDTGGTSAISFPNFSVDSSGNASFGGNLSSVTGKISVGGIELGGNIVAPGHHGLSLSTTDFNNIFLRRDDGVLFFRVGAGTNNSIQWDSSGGTMQISGNLIIGDQYDPGFLRVVMDSDILVNKIKFYNRNYAGWSASFYPYLNREYNLGVEAGGDDYIWNDLYYSGALYDRSDFRVKYEIQQCSLGLDFINKLNPVSYYKQKSKALVDDNGEVIRDENDSILCDLTQGKRRHYGLIAQQVKEAVEEIGIDPDDFAPWALVDKDDKDSTQKLVYDEFISPIIKAIQELSAKVATLESKIV